MPATPTPAAFDKALGHTEQHVCRCCGATTLGLPTRETASLSCVCPECGCRYDGGNIVLTPDVAACQTLDARIALALGMVHRETDGYWIKTPAIPIAKDSDLPHVGAGPSGRGGAAARGTGYTLCRVRKLTDAEVASLGY